MRLSAIIERIKALSKPDDIKELEKFISQMNIIGTVRDRLVHRYVRVTVDGELVSTNQLTSKRARGEQAEIISLSDLDSMAIDCSYIFTRIIMRFCGGLHALGGLDVHPMVGRHPDAPWRYTPSQRDNPKKMTREAQKESKRPRRASRASRPDQSSK